MVSIFVCLLCLMFVTMTMKMTSHSSCSMFISLELNLDAFASYLRFSASSSVISLDDRVQWPQCDIVVLTMPSSTKSESNKLEAAHLVCRCTQQINFDEIYYERATMEPQNLYFGHNRCCVSVRRWSSVGEHQINSLARDRNNNNKCARIWFDGARPMK